MIDPKIIKSAADALHDRISDRTIQIADKNVIDIASKGIVKRNRPAYRGGASRS